MNIYFYYAPLVQFLTDVRTKFAICHNHDCWYDDATTNVCLLLMTQ